MSKFAHTAPETGVVPQAEDPAAGGDELGRLLADIADDVQQHAAAARAGAMAEFAARVAFARKHLGRHELAAALATIKRAREAALALIRQNAARELAERRKAAIETCARRRSTPVKPPRRPRPRARPGPRS